MSPLNPSIAAEVVAACEAGAAEAAQALGRALDRSFELGAVEPGQFAADAAPPGFDGPGLIILLTIGDAGLAIVAPESSGMLPAWYSAPDATERSKLSTLAQELSMLLAPKTLACDKFEAQRVDSINAALRRGAVAPDAATATIAVTSGELAGSLHLVWPLASAAEAFETIGSAATEPAVPPTAATAAPRSGAPTALSASSARPHEFAQLPSYSRSLLKIQLPVSVHLASKRETVQEVVEIVPGAIIKFEKGCDELLHMVVGGQTIAEGEAVKVGDKFGFRVTAMRLPREHFVPVRRPPAGSPAATAGAAG
jgi:flagellar motor switch protein FliN/FliY